MSYTINPNAKNKWARNAENTMDLSLETDASSVYLDNGRTLEQEIGEGSMVSNVATVDSSMSKVIDGTLNGAYESGVMYGRSLVNNNNNKFKERAFNATNTTQATNYALLLDDVAGCPDLNITMVAGKKYLILEKWTILSTTGNGHTLQPKIIDKNGGVTYLSGNGQVKGVGTFTLKRTFTPTVDVDKFYFAITNGAGVTVSGTFHYGMIMEYQEGMENWDIPFFTGLCDVKMPILRNVSNEAFCHDSLEEGSISGNNGGNISSTNSRARTKDMKKLNGATSILFSDNLLGVEKYVFSYDSNKRYLGRTPTNWETGNEIKPVEGAYYYRVVFTKYLEELPRSMYIIPKNHKTNILRTPETLILRSLPNGVRDELNLKTGEYIKRIGEIVLDGSDDENWSISDLDENSVPFFQSNIKGRKGNDKIICDKLIVRKDIPGDKIAVSTTVFGIMGTSSSIIRIKNGSTSLTEFKQWLSQNPITVQYQLEIPITTTIEPLSIPFAYENGHIVLESGFEGQSLLPTLEYSTVVNKTGLIENVAKTIQRQEKQLTMLEKMLIQNIINLDYNNTLLTLKNEMEEML